MNLDPTGSSSRQWRLNILKIKNRKDDRTMLSFLLSHYKKHKTPIITISGIAATAIGFLWNYDLQKLTPSGTLSSQTIWELRMFLTPLIASLYFLTLLIITFHYYKKEVDDLSRTDLTDEDRERLRNLLTCPKCGTSCLHPVDESVKSMLENFTELKKQSELEQAKQKPLPFHGDDVA